MIKEQDINNSHFRTYESCRIVKGAKRTIICDTERKRAHLITEDINTILSQDKTLTIGEIKEKYGKDNEDTIQEYFNYLLDHEFIFLCTKEELKLFPEMDLSWESPSIISDAIIDYDSNSDYDFNAIFNQLIDLGCIHLAIRFYNNIEVSLIENILTLLNESTIEKVEINVKHTTIFSDKSVFETLKKDFPRLTTVIVYNSPIKDINKDPDAFDLNYTKETLKPTTHCGYISPNTFRYNTSFFLESLSFNNCLNKKIAIDTNGDIKNCPSFKNSYGNIKSETLIETINNSDLKHLWTITKDSVDKCKDCEFRYICSDCRAFTEQGDLYSKPLNCGYDPYTAKWDIKLEAKLQD